MFRKVYCSCILVALSSTFLYRLYQCLDIIFYETIHFCTLLFYVCGDKLYIFEGGGSCLLTSSHYTSTRHQNQLRKRRFLFQSIFCEHIFCNICPTFLLNSSKSVPAVHRNKDISLFASFVCNK